MLVAFGRYSGKGAAAVKVTGTINGEKKEFVQDVNFSDNDTKQEFIPRLWATRRVGFLLDEIRKNGETGELKDEVVRLARAHGIVTPYTAYLILEDEARRGVPVAVRTMRELEQDVRAKDAAKAVWDMTVAESRSERMRGGDLAVANATNLGQLRQSVNEQQSGQGLGLDKGGSFSVSGVTASGPALVGGARGGGGGGGLFGNGGGQPADPAAATTPTAAPGESLALEKTANGSLAIRGSKVDVNSSPAFSAAGTADALTTKWADGEGAQHGYRAPARNYAQQARVVKGRAFYQNGSTWTDALASSKTDWKRREVKFGSDEYFTLIQRYPEAAGWLSLGNEVDLVLGEELVSVR
jgi:hypothetical protein